MRYFLIKDKLGNVVAKDAFSGGDKDAQFLVDKGAVEVDATTFSTALVVMSKGQTDWQSAKLSGAAQAVAFIAKQIGLE